MKRISRLIFIIGAGLLGVSLHASPSPDAPQIGIWILEQAKSEKKQGKTFYYLIFTDAVLSSHSSKGYARHFIF